MNHEHFAEEQTSFAIVVAEKSGDESSVITYEDAGPQVTVELQPSRTRASARVLMQVAGEGEGEWYPYVEGDEVLVAIPGGDPRGGVVILGRLSNARDYFPFRVMGQNARKNRTGFRRQRAPFLWEVAEGWVLRQSVSGAFISMEKAGRILLGGSTGAFVAVRDDFVGMQGADPELIAQVNDQKSKVRLQAHGALLELMAQPGVPAGEMIRMLAPQVAIMAAGLPPTHHATSAEAVVNILASFLTVWGAVLAPLVGPLTGGALAATISPAALPGLMNAALAAAAGGTIAPYAGGIAAALLATTPDASGAKPGIGNPAIVF